MPYPLNTIPDWDIQNIRPQASPFALLGLHPAYELDDELLERHYLILQRELHPDRFINKPVEGRTAEMMSAWINKAYTTLKDPVLRAQAMLKIKGCAIPDDQTANDPILLEEALEWRQQLEELNEAKQQEQLLNDLQKTIQSCEQDFSQAWEMQGEEKLKYAYLRLSFLMKTWKQAQQISLTSSVKSI